jgi:hypothetical protein
MTKIFIDEQGRPMHNPNGWPVEPLPGIPSEMTFHRLRLEKAKAEAIPFDLDHDLTFRFLELAAPEQNRIPGNLITTANGEVEVVRICRKGSCMEMDGCYADGMPGEFCAAITVARIKKQESGPYLESREPFKLEDFIKKLVRGFYGIGAVGWAPNPDTDFEAAWKRYINDGIIPEWRTHCSDWKERMPLSILSENIEQLTLGEEMEPGYYELAVKYSEETKGVDYDGDDIINAWLNGASKTAAETQS